MTTEATNTGVSDTSAPGASALLYSNGQPISPEAAAEKRAGLMADERYAPPHSLIRPNRRSWPIFTCSPAASSPALSRNRRRMPQTSLSKWERASLLIARRELPPF